jgi:hypothetical protein
VTKIEDTAMAEKTTVVENARPHRNEHRTREKRHRSRSQSFDRSVPHMREQDTTNTDLDWNKGRH